jgi:hypothetical protein
MPHRCSPMRLSSNQSILEITEFKNVSFDDNITIHYYKRYIPKSRCWFWQKNRFSSNCKEGFWFKIKTFFKNILK